MKTKTLAAIGILLTLVTLGYASADKGVDRPSGIGADQWYPISDRLGLVVSYYQPGFDHLVDNGPVRASPSTELPPPAAHSGTPDAASSSAARKAMPPASAAAAISGYLMIKQDGHWTRLLLVSPSIFPPGTGGTPR